MARRFVVVGVAVAALFALAGCVGIPTTGGILTGPVISGEGPDPQTQTRPGGPQAGSTQEEILEGFMVAVRDPTGGYAVARQFLLKDLEWEPEAGVVIRDPSPVISAGSIIDTLSYTVSTRSSVDLDGLYTERRDSATSSLNFAFVRENGEWRISELADGVVLSDLGFTSSFDEHALYFFDPSHRYLVPDLRWFPTRPTTPTRVVDALLSGPAAWLAPAVISEFPATTTRESVEVSSDAATVDLSTPAAATDNQQRDWMRQQLAATLARSNVTMSVGGVALTAPDASSRAIVNPSVGGTVLVGTGQELGFGGAGDSITPIPGVSASLLQADATAVTLGNDGETAAFLNGGGAWALPAGGGAPQLVDPRPGLVAPGLDPFGYVWSAQAAPATSIVAFEFDGTPHPITATWLPAGATIVSMNVSRDGTRLLLYLVTDGGPRLVVAGIVRTGTAPLQLGDPVDLAVDTSTPVDAAWVDDHTVASLARSGSSSPVWLFGIGSPSSSHGQEVPEAGVLTGGNNGAAGLRLLAEGEVWRPSGSTGWARTGLHASFLGTQQ